MRWDTASRTSHMTRRSRLSRRCRGGARAGGPRRPPRRVKQEARLPRARARGVIGRAVGVPWRRPTEPDMDGWQETTMIGRLNHVAIAVRDIAKAANIYR